jgi:hypothetical protein
MRRPTTVALLAGGSRTQPASHHRQFDLHARVRHALVLTPLIGLMCEELVIAYALFSG